MSELNEKVSALIENQLPEFYKDEAPNIVAFMKAYYEYMEQTGKAEYTLRHLQEYKDVDTTLDEYLEYFRRTILPSIPNEVLANKRILAKNIRDLYQSKGTIESYRLLFRALYNEDVEVFYPAEQILKASSGDWRVERYLVSQYDPRIYNFIGKTIRGIDSGAEALIEDIQRKTVRGRDLMQILVSNINATFADGESVYLKFEDPNITGFTFPIDAGISNITIVSSGAEYRPGDIVDILSDVRGDLGKAVVVEIEDLNGIVVFTLVDGGSGYQASVNDFGSTIQIDETDGLVDASFIIRRDDIVDTFAITLNQEIFTSNTIFGQTAPVIAHSSGNLKMNIFANTIIGAPRFGFKEPAEEITRAADYHDNANAIINIANTAEITVGQSIFGVDSSANGIILDIVDNTAGDSWFRIDGYKNFFDGVTFGVSSEDVKVGTPAGVTVGSVGEFQSNTAGYHVATIAPISGSEVSEGDEIVGAISNAFGVVKKIVTTTSLTYEHNPTANTVLSGTISSSGTTVTGVGTSFTSDFVVNDVIKAGGQTGRRITQIDSDTQLITSAAFSPSLTSEAYGKGGTYRDTQVIQLTSNNVANTSDYFATGPMKAFIENEGLRLVGSATNIGNNAFGTSNTIVENIHTKLIDSLNFIAGTVGTIGQLSSIVSGEGYTQAPGVRVIDTNVAALGIGEVYMVVQSDDVNWQTGNSSITAPDENDRIIQANTAASGDVKQASGFIGHANGTYEITLRVWQDERQRSPENIEYLLSDGYVTINFFDSAAQETQVGTGTAKIVSITDEGILGNNSNITTAIGANGAITRVRMYDSGFSYVDNELVRLKESGRDNSSQATARIALAGVANSAGYYTTTRSHVSSKRGYIQDNNFYQEYSYQIKVPVSIARYRDIVTKLIHPAGQNLFGLYQSQSEANTTSSISTIKKKRRPSANTANIDFATSRRIKIKDFKLANTEMFKLETPDREMLTFYVRGADDDFVYVSRPAIVNSSVVVANSATISVGDTLTGLSSNAYGIVTSVTGATSPVTLNIEHFDDYSQLIFANTHMLRVEGGSVTAATRGSGYANNETLIFSDVGQEESANGYILTNVAGGINQIVITNQGKGYKSAPTITVDTASGSGATITPTMRDGFSDFIAVGKTISDGGANTAAIVEIISTTDQKIVLKVASNGQFVSTASANLNNIYVGNTWVGNTIQYTDMTAFKGTETIAIKQDVVHLQANTFEKTNISVGDFIYGEDSNVRAEVLEKRGNDIIISYEGSRETLRTAIRFATGEILANERIFKYKNENDFRKAGYIISNNDIVFLGNVYSTSTSSNVGTVSTFTGSTIRNANVYYYVSDIV